MRFGYLIILVMFLGGCAGTATRGIIENGEKIPQEYITMDRGMKVEFENVKAEAEPLLKIPDLPPIEFKY